MRKTALTQLIEWSQNDLELFIEDTDEAIRIFKAIKDKATELLETEREQIEEAHDAANINWRAGSPTPIKDGYTYYKDTYE